MRRSKYSTRLSTANAVELLIVDTEAFAEQAGAVEVGRVQRLDVRTFAVHRAVRALASRSATTDICGAGLRVLTVDGARTAARSSHRHAAALNAPKGIAGGLGDHRCALSVLLTAAHDGGNDTVP